MSVLTQFAGKTIYMIFVDRFAIGGNKSSAEKFADPAYSQYHEEIVLKQWDERPVNPSLGNDYFGGDLQGIIDRADYLQELGVDYVLLSPIFKAQSNHKYDTVDYFAIDPMFGDLDTLRRLIQELKRRGIGLLLDAVINHVGDQHPWFKAAKNGVAKYRDYFFFREDGGYAAWWDFAHLPELNIEHEELRDYFYRKPDSVLKFYLDLGVAGWRFDAAPDVGMPYIRDISSELARSHPDAILIGELTCFASQWVQPGVFHGAMNYFMRQVVFSWLHGSVESRQLALAVQRYCDEFGEQAALVSWNILSSQDQPRLATQIPDLDLRVIAITLQFTLPGNPVIYYGEEVGLLGGADPDCRAPMPWSEQAWSLQERQIYKHFINLRRRRREFREGRFMLLSDQIDDAEFFAFMRHTEVPEEFGIVLVNCSSSPLRRTLFLPYSHAYDGVLLTDNINPERTYRISTGSIEVTLAPLQVAILVPKLDQFSSFRFFKPRALAREQRV